MLSRFSALVLYQTQKRQVHQKVKESRNSVKMNPCKQCEGRGLQLKVQSPNSLRIIVVILFRILFAEPASLSMTYVTQNTRKAR